MSLRTAKTCGPGTPGLVLSAQDVCLACDGDYEVTDTGESTVISRKPSRREGRVAPVEPVVSNSCAFYNAHEAAGATSIRSSLRPLSSEGQCRCKARAQNAPRERGRVFQRLSSLRGAKRRSNPVPPRDSGSLRFARNDGRVCRVGKAKRAHHLRPSWMRWERRKSAFAHPTT
jgi:hypothetical protein